MLNPRIITLFIFNLNALLFKETSVQQDICAGMWLYYISVPLLVVIGTVTFEMRSAGAAKSNSNQTDKFQNFHNYQNKSQTELQNRAED